MQPKCNYVISFVQRWHSAWAWWKRKGKAATTLERVHLPVSILIVLVFRWKCGLECGNNLTFSNTLNKSVKQTDWQASPSAQDVNDSWCFGANATSVCTYVNDLTCDAYSRRKRSYLIVVLRSFIHMYFHFCNWKLCIWLHAVAAY